MKRTLIVQNIMSSPKNGYGLQLKKIYFNKGKCLVRHLRVLEHLLFTDSHMSSLHLYFVGTLFSQFLTKLVTE